MEPLIRKSCVSGSFYQSDADSIKKTLHKLAEKEKEKINYSLADKSILGAILPHAGHMYSGYQTIHFFEIFKQSGQFFDTWVVIHPIHQGGELDYSAEGSDFWNTPLGNVRIDKEFIEQLEIPVSIKMHKSEHSSEVILPFIQHYCSYDFSYVSIGISRQNPNTTNAISNMLTRATRLSKKKICILASSDFSHYVEPEVGRIMDQKIIDCILKKDVESIYREISENNHSVCGYGPIMVLCTVLNKLYPAAIPVVLARGHSGEVHPSSKVVDYTSIVFNI